MSSKFIQPGKLIIFSAPSGAGKTTIVHHILEKFGIIEFSVSACSRKKRVGEKEGKDYYFLGVNGFKEKIKQNEAKMIDSIVSSSYISNPTNIYDVFEINLLKDENETLKSKNEVYHFY